MQCHSLVLYSHLQHHNDTTTKTDAWRMTQEDFFNIIFTSHFIARVRKGCSRFACERVLETEHKLHILTPLLWPSRCVFLVLLDAQPEVLGSTAGCWLSLLHLISIFSGPKLIRASSPIGLVWLSLPHLVSNSLEFYWQLLWHPTQLNYIIIQRPHDLFRWLAIGMCHFLPVHHLGMAFLGRVEGQNITLACEALYRRDSPKWFIVDLTTLVHSGRFKYRQIFCSS